MADKYWEQLVSASQAFLAPDSDSNGSSALMALLTAPQESEAAYRPPDVDTRDEAVPGESGNLTVRIYTPAWPSAVLRPLFVWVHGGGWAGGELDDAEADATSREVAVRADAVVVSIGYRLAVQGAHFPLPLNDVVAGYRWAFDHATELGVDRGRVSLGGASAGATLAAGAVLRLRDEGQPIPRSLALAYGTFHPTLPAPSNELSLKLAGLDTAFAFAPEIYRPMVENYLGAPDTDATDYAMPGTSDDLSRFPPTYLFNCEYDGLRASGEVFAQQLADAGNIVFQETIANVAHANLARPGLPQAEQSHRSLAAWVRDQVVPGTACAVAPDQSTRL